jgi:AraC-like DNA-binding protein
MAEGAGGMYDPDMPQIEVPASPGSVDSDPLHVRVFYARETVIGDWWRERGISSVYWRYYVNSRSGAAVRLADGRVHPLPPGHAHFIPAWVRIDLLGSVPVGHLYAHFDIVGLPGTLVREVFDAPAAVPLTGAVRASAEAMRAALRHPAAAERPQALFAVKAAVHAALAELFDRLPRERAERIAAVLRPDSPVAPALRWIDAHLQQPVRVAALARLCGYAEAHFARLFRAEVGQAPGQYLLERRVAVAAQRLVLSDEPIERIAESCGFTDRFYFSRVFARRMGMPPAAYRRAEPPTRTRPPKAPA